MKFYFIVCICIQLTRLYPVDCRPSRLFLQAQFSPWTPPYSCATLYTYAHTTATLCTIICTSLASTRHTYLCNTTMKYLRHLPVLRLHTTRVILGTAEHIVHTTTRHPMTSMSPTYMRTYYVPINYQPVNNALCCCIMDIRTNMYTRYIQSIHMCNQAMTQAHIQQCKLSMCYPHMNVSCTYDIQVPSVLSASPYRYRWRTLLPYKLQLPARMYNAHYITYILTYWTSIQYARPMFL